MHNRFTSFNSLSDYSMSAAEKQRTLIPLLVNNSVASSGVRGWHLMRSRATIIFCLTTCLVALISPFPVPQYLRYLHVPSKFIAWRFSELMVNSGAGSCSLRFLSNDYLSPTNILSLHWFAFHTAVNSWTNFSSFCLSSFCMPPDVSAKIETSSMNHMLLNW